MKGCNVIGVLMFAVSFLCCATGYAYEVHTETLDHNAYQGTGGGGYASAFDFPYAHASASACIEDEDPNCWAWAYAYSKMKTYITDYDCEDPELTGYVTGMCEVKVTAFGNAGSDYWVKAAALGSGAGYSCYASVEITEPNDADIDVDWFGEYVDMSYSGATVYYQHAAHALAEAYSTPDTLECYANADSQTFVRVDEE
jgi:hypothetical protein